MQAKTKQKILQIKEQKLSITYLSFMLHSKVSKELWNPVPSKIQNKLSNWTNKWLTLASRVQLVQAVLQAILIHLLSLLLIPAQVSGKTTTEQKDFLWQGTDTQFKLPITKWDTVSSSIRNEDLNIRKVGQFTVQSCPKNYTCLENTIGSESQNTDSFCKRSSHKTQMSHS